MSWLDATECVCVCVCVRVCVCECVFVCVCVCVVGIVSFAYDKSLHNACACSSCTWSCVRICSIFVVYMCVSYASQDAYHKHMLSSSTDLVIVSIYYCNSLVFLYLIIAVHVRVVLVQTLYQSVHPSIPYACV